MTIKFEKWDGDRPADIQRRSQFAKPLVFSAASIFFIVLFPCMVLAWFFAWTWVEPESRTGLDSSAVAVAFAVIIHAAHSAFLLLIKLWYVSVPAVWLNALAISRRIEAKSERQRKQHVAIA